ncbi:MAG: hypothetical protein OSA89_04000 [Mariniblastus sp.]|nr:hypothetical protein [Mariniblastus sp.]
MFLRSRQTLPANIDAAESPVIPQPQSADWNDMDTTDKNQFIGYCKKHVLRIDTVDISRIDQTLQNGQKVCLRFAPNLHSG